MRRGLFRGCRQPFAGAADTTLRQGRAGRNRFSAISPTFRTAALSATARGSTFQGPAQPSGIVKTLEIAVDRILELRFKTLLLQKQRPVYLVQLSPEVAQIHDGADRCLDSRRIAGPAHTGWLGMPAGPCAEPRLALRRDGGISLAWRHDVMDDPYPLFAHFQPPIPLVLRQAGNGRCPPLSQRTRSAQPPMRPAITQSSSYMTVTPSSAVPPDGSNGGDTSTMSAPTTSIPSSPRTT